MAKNVKINGVLYPSVPKVSIPLSEGQGSAEFHDISDATAAAGDIVTGKTAYAGNGLVTGSMANNGAISGTIAKVGDSYPVPAGYHNGAGSVKISPTEQAKIISANIKAGVNILGVSGKNSVVDTSDATAGAGTIVSGKTAYVNGALSTVSVSQDSLTKVLTIE